LVAVASFEKLYHSFLTISVHNVTASRISRGPLRFWRAEKDVPDCKPTATIPSSLVVSK
jgi:hypothetical protein